ncbi:hypothetical protein HAX54_049489 [Datura stramonium]|uniref:Uncharacterized protein n=1 Tax=Datura stramonium TaxID=4076 RepID=A0ABS8RQN2_DATST|nr:hypothetical protein [Datura stramonium]
MEGVMINVALFIFSLYDNEDEAIGEVNALDFPSMIQRVSAVISQAIRFSLQSVLPKIDGLGFIDFLLDNMKEFLISRYSDSIPSAKNQLEAVLKELESVQPFIKDVVAGKCLEHDRFKHLAALVIGKAYEIEYIVDFYMTKDVPGWCLTPWLSDIIEEIEFVTAEVKKIQGNVCNSRADNVDDVTNGCTSSLLASTPSIAEEMVGFEDVVQILGNQLVSGKPAQLDVISLVGYNGQGKTTVANKLFTDELVVSLFDVRARCFVSEVYERRELLVAILNDVLGKPIDDLSEVHEDEIADKLHKLLSPKRYLMLIDNVNDPIAWDFLKSCFPDVINGSRIILTTRLDEVANYARGVSPPHYLRLFSDEESWMLLQHKVFPNKSCPPVLRPYIQRLSKECNGLPFHVVILASGLARMSNKELELLAKGDEGALMVFYEELMKKVREVFANRVCVSQPENISNVSGCYRSCLLAADTISEEMVGFKDVMQQITRQLVRGTPKRDVISIVGMAGQGKTTLANTLFIDKTVVSQFDVRAKCHVSQVYERRELLVAILSDVVDKLTDYSEVAEDELADKLRRLLLSKRYLILIDDVWETRAWDELQLCFPDANNGSRIILTSRLDIVANYARCVTSPHHLRLFSDEESWMLLQKKVFLQRSCPLDLEGIGKEIAKKCGRLPLSVVLVAGVVASMMKKEQWEQVADNLASQILGDSKQIIQFSYKDLPHHLKPCFLYFGAFLEDKEIQISKLMKLWIAEGFVVKQKEKCLADLAEYYLEDLIRRNMVMATKKGYFGKVKACRIHDLLLEFCKEKTKEENFLLQMYRDQDENSANMLSQMIIQRRLSIYSKQHNLVDESPSCSSVHSILFRNLGDGVVPSIESLSSFSFHRFKCLRVLDLEFVTIDSFPTKLSSHLRYLALRTVEESIPSSIANLQNLETLVVKGLGNELSLPHSLCKMVKMRHLHLKDRASFDLQNLKLFLEDPSQLENLESFSTPAFSCGEDVLRKTPNLQKLRCIWGFPEDCNQFPELQHLTKLESLKVFCFPWSREEIT